MSIRSTSERRLWAQFDALQLGSGWDEADITKPQILVEDAFGDSHPGSVHLDQLSEHVCRSIYECAGTPGRFLDPASGWKPVIPVPGMQVFDTQKQQMITYYPGYENS